MSKQERVSWVSLGLTVLVGVWYFGRVLQLPADAALGGDAMRVFVTQLIVNAVLIAILGEAALRWAQRRVGGEADSNAVDERDRLIDLKATRVGHTVLVFGVFAVLAQILLIEWVHRNAALRNLRPAAETVLQALGTGPLTPMLVAQLLLAALMLAGVALYASRIVYYRRGG